MTDTPKAEVHMASYRRSFRFGDVWVQKFPINGKWRWRIPELAAFKNWSVTLHSTHEDAFHVAEYEVGRMPHMTQPEAMA